jgi:hypothetical protein
MSDKNNRFSSLMQNESNNNNNNNNNNNKNNRFQQSSPSNRFKSRPPEKEKEKEKEKMKTNSTEPNKFKKQEQKDETICISSEEQFPSMFGTPLPLPVQVLDYKDLAKASQLKRETERMNRLKSKNVIDLQPGWARLSYNVHNEYIEDYMPSNMDYEKLENRRIQSILTQLVNRWDEERINRIELLGEDIKLFSEEAMDNYNETATQFDDDAYSSDGDLDEYALNYDDVGIRQKQSYDD